MTCQVRFARLLVPDSVSRRFSAFRMELAPAWHPVAGAPCSKQSKLDRTLPSKELSDRKWRVPSGVDGIRYYGAIADDRAAGRHAKSAVRLAVRA